MASDLNYAAACTGLNAIYDGDFPAGSVLELRTGFAPGPENTATGTLVVSIVSPASPWLTADVLTGMKFKNGVWSGLSLAAGVIGYHRFRNAADTRREEGSVSVTGGGGDATVNTLTVGSIGLTIVVNTFTKRLVRH